MTRRPLKTELHHWWPRTLAEHWAAADGMVSVVRPEGEVRRAPPGAFGAITNAHHMKISESFICGEHRQFQHHGHNWLDPLLDDLSQYNRWGKVGTAGICSCRPYSESLQGNRWLDQFVTQRR